jgi:bifunctional non-homologous end joining protein LigD
MRQTRAPGFVEPMLLASGRDLPSAEGWWAELKLDGARGQLRVVDGVPGLRTRRGRRCDDEFPQIIAAAAGLPDVILDGEIVVPGEDGGPDFAALRARFGAGAVRARAGGTARPAVFYAFDVLWHQGVDLRGCPLVGRRRVLESLPLSGAVRLVDTHPGQAATVLAFAREHFLEGVVVKRADSPHRSGRSNFWQKFKIRHPERVWVTAWLPGGPGELDRYWVGRQVDGRLVPSGEVSYGLTLQQAATLRRVLHTADVSARSRHGLRPVAPVVAMTVAGHGPRSGRLRDPVITAVHIDPSDHVVAPMEGITPDRDSRDLHIDWYRTRG